METIWGLIKLRWIVELQLLKLLWPIPVGIVLFFVVIVIYDKCKN
jgi:hypothetical protein